MRCCNEFIPEFQGDPNKESLKILKEEVERSRKSLEQFIEGLEPSPTEPPLGCQADWSAEELDDWFTSKEREEKSRFHYVQEVINAIANLEELVTLCRYALDECEVEGIKDLVANVLYTYVQEELSKMKMILRTI